MEPKVTNNTEPTQPASKQYYGESKPSDKVDSFGEYMDSEEKARYDAFQNSQVSLDTINNAGEHDAIQTGDGKFYVKYNERTANPTTGEETRETRWHEASTLGNISFPPLNLDTIWQDQDKTPVKKFIREGEVPEVTGNNGITSEELVQKYNTTKPTTESFSITDENVEEIRARFARLDENRAKKEAAKQSRNQSPTYSNGNHDQYGQIINEDIPEQEISLEDLNTILNNAKTYDCIVTKPKAETGQPEVYVKMSKLSWDSNGAQKTEIVWTNLRDLGNISYPGMTFENIWEEQADTPIKRYIWEGEKPELTSDTNLSTEELITLLQQSGVDGYTPEEDKTPLPKEPDPIPQEPDSSVYHFKSSDLDHPTDILQENQEPEIPKKGEPSAIIPFEQQEQSLIPAGHTEVPQQALALVGPLTQEEQEEYREAGRGIKDFFAVVKRSFEKTGGWKRLISSVGASAAGAAGIAALTTTGIVAAPAIATGAAALMAVTGVGYIWKGIKQIRQQGYSSVRELWNDRTARKEFLKGMAIGGGSKGVGALIASANPALGLIAPLISFGAEMGVHIGTERDSITKQDELLNSYLTEYSKRQYQKVVGSEYTIARPDGNTSLNLEKILTDARDATYNGQKETAIKVAISTLRYLAEKTGVQDRQFLISPASQHDYPANTQYDLLDPNLSVHQMNLSAISPEDIDKLLNQIQETWSNIPDQQREDAATVILAKYLELETIDVDKLLEKQRELQLEGERRLTTFRASMMITNGMFAVIGGGVRLLESAQAGIETSQATQQQMSEIEKQQYTRQFRDTDATFEKAMDGRTEVIGADLDSDGDIDVWFKNGKYYPNTDEGLGKAFELNNGTTVADIEKITPSANSNVTGIFRDNQGNALGISYKDSNGHIGMLTNEELGGALKVGGNNVQINNVETGGIAHVTVGTDQYKVNLASLAGIPGTTETTISDPLDIVIKEGDSMNRAVQNLVAKLNTEYGTNIDPIQAERVIAMGLGSDGMELDATLRGNAGDGGVLNTDNVVHFRNVLKTLEGMNSGNPIPPAVSTITGTPGIPVELSTADAPTVIPSSIPSEAENKTSVVEIIGTALGLGGLLGRYNERDIKQAYTARFVENDIPQNTATPIPSQGNTNTIQTTRGVQETTSGIVNIQPSNTQNSANTDAIPKNNIDNEDVIKNFNERYNMLNSDLKNKLEKGSVLTEEEKRIIRTIFLNPQTGKWDSYIPLQRQYYPGANNGNNEDKNKVVILNNIEQALR